MHKRYTKNTLSVFLLFALQLPGMIAIAQTGFKNTRCDLLISGTSTLHDWTMKSAKADCSATFDLSPTGQITRIIALSFSTPATALKSGHTGMDNNAYKALKSDKNPTIFFNMTSAALTPLQSGVSVTCKGKLSIAGTVLEEDITAVCQTNPDGSITVTGTKPISMKQYNIEPPTFAFGTVKTGNDIVFTFHLTLKKV